MILFENVRGDKEAFLDSDNVFYDQLKLSPYIAFVEKDENIIVRVIIKVDEVLELPDETKLMCLWPGKYRSDYFQFSVAELKAGRISYFEKQPSLKKH